MELLLQVRERVVHVLVPLFHVPRGPVIECHELAKIPPKDQPDGELQIYYLLLCNRIVGRFYECVYMRGINFLHLSRNMQASDPNQLKLFGVDVVLLSGEIGVDELYCQVKGLPLQPVVR